MTSTWLSGVLHALFRAVFLNRIARRAELLFLCLFLALPGTGSAMFAQMSDDDLIRLSELVVVGEWLGQTALIIDGKRLEFGVVRVGEVLKGTADTTVALVLVPAPDAPRSGSDLHFKRGDSGVWFLRSQPRIPGAYAVDHPQRFVAGPPARIEALRRKIGQGRLAR